MAALVRGVGSLRDGSRGRARAMLGVRDECAADKLLEPRQGSKKSQSLGAFFFDAYQHATRRDKYGTHGTPLREYA